MREELMFKRYSTYIKIYLKIIKFNTTLNHDADVNKQFSINKFSTITLQI